MIRNGCNKKILLASVVVSMFGTACTSILVEPMRATPRPQKVCIEENPKVLVRDFVDVLREGIARHGMTSEVYSGEPPSSCDLNLFYTALRSWDFAPYLAKAEIWLEQHDEDVGYAEYHLVGGGGFSLMKWQGTKAKIDPVIDRLFSTDYEVTP